MTKRVALYGGAFDPCHIAHFAWIAQLLNSKLVDEVWVLPSGERPDKTYNAGDADRLSMLRLGVAELFRDDPRVLVRAHHLDKKTGHSSIELLEKLEIEYPEYKFFIVIGSELVKDLPTWHQAEKLSKKANFLVITRPGSEEITLPQYSLQFLPNPHSISFFISSTELRAMLKNGNSLAGLVPTSVLEYIQENKLYV